jgi:transposase
MDSSPPRPNQEWPTPSRRTSRVLKRYANYSERQVAAATGIPKSTVHDHLSRLTSRTYRQRGRKAKISISTIEKMIKALKGHYKERVKLWAELRED